MYLPSGEITALRMGASGGLAVIRFSIARAGVLGLARHTMSAAITTTATEMIRKYQPRCFPAEAVRRPPCSCGCSVTADASTGSAGAAVSLTGSDRSRFH